VKFRIIMISCLLLMALVVSQPTTRAQTAGSEAGDSRSQWRALRQEMMKACLDKSAETPCSFSRDSQTVNGTCQTTRRGKLVCRGGEGGRSGEMRGRMGD
jgi:isoaspartyl peptidase/L-asparaginase-like protein (Ntn-hydrolase superfamily)